MVMHVDSHAWHPLTEYKMQGAVEEVASKLGGLQMSLLRSQLLKNSLHS